MIRAEEFEAYNRGAAEIGDGAASAVEQRVLGWCRSHKDATVAEKREAAKLIMEGFVQAYDDKAAEFASQWYDYRAEQGGARLKQAVTMTVYEPGSVDDVARYQAKKLAKEGDAAFARACGEFARNDAFRSLNETIIANVGRDRDEGAMFARVPTGTETCTFCLMLASRGAVYHTRKTAGEWRHFHRGCDCKVVPSFEDDPEAELVQGVKPRELYELYKQFKEIESYKLPRAQEDALKAARADAAGDGVFSRATSDSELAAYFDAGVKDAVKRFRKSKTVNSYDATVNAYLSLLGDAYGIELAGERYVNSKGRCNGADPNGEELWAIVRHGEPGKFLYATTERKRADFETSSCLIEIKTPRSEAKINSLLVNASKKFYSDDKKERQALLSLLRIPSAADIAADAAKRFVDDGTFSKVNIVG